MARNRLTVGVALVLAASLAACAAPAPAPIPASSPSPTPASSGNEDQPPVALFIGDSYTTGAGLAPQDMRLRWSTQVAEQMGWREVNAGCNGSGYERRGLYCNNTYVERVPLLADPVPDIVIVSGGVNDLGATSAQIAVAVAETFAELRSAFPDADIIAVGGIYYEGDERPQLLQHLNDAVARGTADVGGVFVDIGEPLLDDPALVGLDRLHPNVAGHTRIADETVRALAAVGYSPG